MTHDIQANATRSCRVAIAGTVTNAATGELMPQAVVRIAAAPTLFAEKLMAILAAAIAQRPLLQTHYRDLIEGWARASNPLATAQLLLDRLQYPLGLPRPDQTRSGGDGHYCFFDLPPGLYTLAATYVLANQCHGATAAQIEVVASDHRLAFAELDIAIGLVPGVWPLQVMEEVQPTPGESCLSPTAWPQNDDVKLDFGNLARVEQSPRAETRSR